MTRKVLVEDWWRRRGPTASLGETVSSTLGFGDVEQRGTARRG